jgi:sugar phosphate isomerase/epimerase
VRIGYNTWSMATVPYREFVPGLAEIGYTALAISVVPGYTIGGRYVPNAGALDGLSADDRRRLRSMLDERGLALPSVVGNQSLVSPEADAHALARRRLEAAIDLCVELSPDGRAVPTLNTGVGGRPGELETKRQMIVDRLGELVEHARRRGVVVCIEPHVGAAIDTLERSEWIVRTIDSPHLRLDFDVSHFEVVGVPSDESVPRLAPLAGAAEIKDQRFRYLNGASTDDDWLVAGNGVGEATAPDGRRVAFQFLLGGEGSFDLAKYLRLMHAQGFAAPIAFEASVQCQARPGYDALAAAATTYRWRREGWRRAGVPID